MDKLAKISGLYLRNFFSLSLDANNSEACLERFKSLTRSSNSFWEKHFGSFDIPSKSASFCDELGPSMSCSKGLDIFLGTEESGNIAKSKWKNLKDQFRRETQKIPVLKSGSKAIPTKSKWQYFESMQFLRDYTTPAPTQGNLNDTRHSQVNETQQDASENTDDEIEHSTSNDESDADVTMN
ncbi:unnamed protein product [Psylliodes chrysocephalus]|uniref:MADF domain-containing protein n=1 Tax=Psylliodes chrysocephalus TaxID=3402493 RepID=A0A9P0CHD1_9CUCU|nr:unnamed protein product [Psylliodes chrysocephala]